MSKSKFNFPTQTHIRNDKFCCTICCYSTNNINYITIHSKKKHFIDFQFHCTECDYTTTNKRSFKCHSQGHIRDYKFQCFVCNYKTNNVSYISIHTKKQHSLEFDFQCLKCEYTTTNKSKFRRHNLGHTKDFEFFCDVCDYSTNNKSYFKIHKLKHFGKTEFHCLECDYTTINKDDFKEHQRNHLDEHFFYCNICDYKTNNINYITIHSLNRHSVEFVFECMECHYTTTDKSNYRHHQQNHFITYKYYCSECDYGTNNESYIGVHTKKKHSIEFQFQCVDCNYTTTNKSNFRYHKQAHTGTYKFHCNGCDFRTNNKRYIHIHEQKHLAEFQLRCIECDFVTMSKKKFSLHIQSHTQYYKSDCNTDNDFLRPTQKYPLDLRIKNLKTEDNISKNSIKIYEKNHMRKNKMSDKIFDVNKNKPILTIDNQIICEELTLQNLKFDHRKRKECNSADIKNISRKVKCKYSIKYEFNCNECNYVTNEEDKFGLHKIKFHPLENNSNCKKSFLNQNLKQSGEHKFDQFECTCEAILNSKYVSDKCKSNNVCGNLESDFINHNWKHSVQGKFSCDNCDYKASQDHKFTNHKLNHLKINGQSHIPCEDLIIKNNLLLNGRKSNVFKCEYCHFKTSKVRNFNKHTIIHSKSNKNILNHLKISLPIYFKKKIDTKMFNRKLYKNLKFSAGERRSNLNRFLKNKKCNLYKILFTERRNLQNLKLKNQAHPKKYKSYFRMYYRTYRFHCIDCDYMTRIYSLLLKHQEKCHAMKKKMVNYDKPNNDYDEIKEDSAFQCDSCNYTTSQLSYLVSHEMEHTEEKTFRCVICTFCSFSRVKFLNHYSNQVHNCYLDNNHTAS